MSDPIYLRLIGRQDLVNPANITDAIKSFWGILKDLDATITQDSRGTVKWGIESISMGSPTLIAFRGQSRLIGRDITPEVHDKCVTGLRTIDEQGEIPGKYSDAVVSKILHLAKLQDRRDSMGLSAIQVKYAQNTVSLTTRIVENIQALVETKYESITSVVGNLDSISVHRGSEFRVWEEITNRPVTCRFNKEMQEQAAKLLGRRVLVYGDVRANFRGQPVLIQVEGIEPYPPESELPTIEEMSGSIPDITGGLSLSDYLEEIRNG